MSSERDQLAQLEGFASARALGEPPSKPLRLPGWERSFAEYLRAHRHTPFAWGTHDCCLHAFAVVQLLTGTDHAEDIRGTYTTAQGAAAILRQHYGGSTWNVPEKRGLQPIAITFTRRGDMVGEQVGRRRALGICDGIKSYFVGPKGLVAVRTLDCKRAWRVG